MKEGAQVKGEILRENVGTQYLSLRQFVLKS